MNVYAQENITLVHKKIFEDNFPSVWQKEGKKNLWVHHLENNQVKYGKCQSWNIQYLAAFSSNAK